MSYVPLHKEERAFDDEEKMRDLTCSELEHLPYWRESFWQQKSRLFWLGRVISGTKFFRRVLNSPRRNNYIDSLYLQGSELSDAKILVIILYNFFKRLYTDSIAGGDICMERPQDYLVVEATRCTERPQDFLIVKAARCTERPFEEDEDRGIVKYLNGDKASGLEGNIMAFFQAYWVAVKKNKVFPCFSCLSDSLNALL